MPGVRLRHPTRRNERFVATDNRRPYRVPYACLECGTTHECKTYHLELDDEGTVIVSKEIADRLLTLNGGEFEFANVVENPPAQTLTMSVPILRGGSHVPQA